jgi:hypothetical protein
LRLRRLALSTHPVEVGTEPRRHRQYENFRYLIGMQCRDAFQQGSHP